MLCRPLRYQTASEYIPLKWPLLTVATSHGGRLLCLFCPTSRIPRYIPLPLFSSVLCCAIIFASAAHPRLTHTDMYIIPTLRLNLTLTWSYSRYTKALIRQPTITNGRSPISSDPIITKYIKCLHVPTRVLRWEHYVGTSISPATFITGRTPRIQCLDIPLYLTPTYLLLRNPKIFHRVTPSSWYLARLITLQGSTFLCYFILALFNYLHISLPPFPHEPFYSKNQGSTTTNMHLVTTHTIFFPTPGGKYKRHWGLNIRPIVFTFKYMGGPLSSNI